ncbi:Sua5/YciO/YrdC/YwlC family protein [Mycoplasma phocimorsus]|uniref:L-threonylcarbamoyladenylate synthase n=1 Tax=Mycoplasma phocimorsus TaxID=3045839 RepID=A0AAJ1PSL8_9MOLU|nr:Sua5/YciO/YrdC/YwlC family protein [Mycoplasma phocimorsus]MDJ1645759.1 Sua5/YciO/YrdC/YwlC family protein [Mycoplasma phocimorsus]MDJ1646683.1 Sua5/YciO/YrdC/YwlC family protein [Mycoplasma phocimorsus]MDJ1647268.1 Sua5/YciO/YrdC/YwlC family protein [Mycoplasma phocimorsus]MDJ1647917.1 Sua5/YciO/YrdC/YwlC family protein [Mycoplasma phocimorsus]MDJ1648031.1 Sua5/YciO/YrdC/YwlC family protein [Mycoplasma phocimorsus]
MINWEKLWLVETDTVCGIGCFFNDCNLDDLYAAKNRNKEKKIMILVGSIQQAESFKQWNKQASKWAKINWPGAHSIIVNNQGFRMPNSEKLCNFLLKNGPMYLTSANISGEPTLSLKQAKKVFKNISNFVKIEPENITNNPSSIYDLNKKIFYR